MAIYCYKCGQKLEDGSKFCFSCGTHVAVAPTVHQSEDSQPEQAENVTNSQPGQAENGINSQPGQNQNADTENDSPVMASENEEAAKTAQKEDKKGFRLAMSWIFSILAFICLTLFFATLLFKKTTDISSLTDIVAKIDITEVKIGDFADELDYDDIDEDTTVAEAFVTVCSDMVSLDIDEKDVDSLLKNEEFKESVQNVYVDLIEIAGGEGDSDDLEDDLIAVLDGNRKIIKKKTGYEILDEDSLRKQLDRYMDVAMGDLEDNINISEIIKENDDLEVLDDIISVSDLIPYWAIYLLLVLGIIDVGLVVFFNRFKLQTGFRFDGIVLLLIGLFWSIVGVAMRLAANINGSSLKKLGLDDIIEGIENYKEIINTLVKTVVSGLADAIHIFSIPMAVIGVGMIVASVIISKKIKK